MVSIDRQAAHGKGSEKPARILLGDDHALILEGLRSLLSDDFEIAGAATDGRELVNQAARLKPDAVLLDLSMPVLNGMEAARQIRKLLPDTKILFLTQRSEYEYVRMARELGAAGYLIKDSITRELIPAIRNALAGKDFISPFRGKSGEEGLREPITPRQREVIRLVAEGKSNKEIANLLNVSVKTVNFHKANLMDALNLRTTAELTRYAIKLGIIEG